MEFSVSNAAAQWFIKELDLKPGSYVKIFTKIYGGIPTNYPNFFLGIGPGEASEVIEVKVETENITIYIEHGSEWILDEHNLSVELDGNEVKYNFSE